MYPLSSRWNVCKNGAPALSPTPRHDFQSIRCKCGFNLSGLTLLDAGGNHHTDPSHPSSADGLRQPVGVSVSPCHMIEIAPTHKRGLSLAGPVMNVAGFMGFANEYRRLVNFTALGAFVTNPITARARTPASGRRVLEFHGGALIHTGLPNPGVRRAIRRYGRKWRAMPCPVIVHVAATTPAEVAECLELLEAVEGVAGVELGIKEGVRGDEVERLVAAGVQSSALPVVVRVPFLGGAEAAQAAQSAGVVAVTASGPPRGTLLFASGERVRGRVVGAGLFPLALNAVCAIISATDLPVIAAGGIHNARAARDMLAAGAVAFQVDGQLWRNPAELNALTSAFAPASTREADRDQDKASV